MKKEFTNVDRAYAFLGRALLVFVAVVAGVTLVDHIVELYSEAEDDEDLPEIWSTEKWTERHAGEPVPPSPAESGVNWCDEDDESDLTDNDPIGR